MLAALMSSLLQTRKRRQCQPRAVGEAHGKKIEDRGRRTPTFAEKSDS